jgi:two-component system sensor histidine kinase/response regulator
MDTTQDASSLRELLETIPGLDVECGLRTTAGRMEPLVRLLIKYADVHAEDGPQLQAWEAAGEREPARRLAHSVKGAAGFLGLSRIQNLAGDLEEAFLAGQEAGQTAPLLASFAQENGSLCRAISATLVGTPQPTNNP